MADIYVRRGSAPVQGPSWWLWAGLLLVILLAGLGLWRLGLRLRARRMAPATAGVEAPVTAEAEASEPTHTARPLPPPPPARTPPAASAAAPAPDAGQEASVSVLIERARQKLEAEDPVEARRLAREAHERARTAGARRQAEDVLGEIHIRLVFNPYPMEEKIEHVVQRGESLDVIGRKYGVSVPLLVRGNQVRNPNTIHVGQRFRVLQGTFRLEVSTRANEMTVFLNDRFFKRYRVGTGRFEQTPTGTFRVTDKIAQPQWYRPDGRVIPYGHPDNELGTHWLSLDIPRYGIHGTWEPETIGQRSSAGCIRLLNEQVEELYILIPVGSEVVIAE